MKAEIEAVIIDGKQAEQSLSILLEVTLLEVLENRHLFPNPLDEPIFYRRHFKKWVADAVREKNENEKAFGDILERTETKILGT